MSNISSNHNIVNYISGQVKPLIGQRLAKVIFRAARDGSMGEKKQSKAASIPLVSRDEISDSLPKFLPHLVELVESTQDKIVRDAVESDRTSISDSELSIEAVLAFLESETSNSRLSKEDIYFWFEENLSDMLTVAFSDKLGIDSNNPSTELLARVEKTVDIYKESFAQLVGGKTRFAKDKAEKLLKALEVAEANDAISIRFEKRLKSMIEAPTMDLMGL